MSFPNNNGSDAELRAVNQVLAAIGQAPVTTLVDQTNPDVAIVSNTLDQASREVQSEGWTFNKEFNLTITPDINQEIKWSDAMIELDLSNAPEYLQRSNYNTVKREGKLYDRQNHTFKFPQPIKCDVTWLFNWEDIPIPIQDLIVSKAATKCSMHLVGDPNQYQALQQQEGFCRAYAMEYECNQGDYSFFGAPRDGTDYIPYQPYLALWRI
jgi:hypothetical protein